MRRLAAVPCRAALRSLAAAAVLALCCAALPAPAADDAPMRTEDVVRMLVSGVSRARIVDEIRTRPVEFDLSDDMVAELRIAGVPEEIIEAMRERQAELAPPEPEPGPVEPAPAPGLVRVVLWTRGEPAEGDEVEPAPAVVFPGRLSPAAAEALQVPGGDDPPVVDGLAVFLICRTAHHVPDHWRSKSPLGRDFVSMPRHRMLAFAQSDERVERKGLGAKLTRMVTDGPDDFVRLELPPALEGRADPAEPHDLSLGVAIRAAGRWLRIQSDDQDAVAFDGDVLILRGRVGRAADGPGIEAVFEDE